MILLRNRVKGVTVKGRLPLGRELSSYSSVPRSLQSPALKNLYQPLVLSVLDNQRRTRVKKGDLIAGSLETVNAFATFVSKRYSVIRERGSALEGDKLAIGRIAGMLPSGLRERREATLKGSLKLFESRSKKELDVKSLNLLMASVCILDPSFISKCPKGKAMEVLEQELADRVRQVLRGGGSQSIDAEDLDLILLTAHALNACGQDVSTIMAQFIGASISSGRLGSVFSVEEEGEVPSRLSETRAAVAQLERLVLILRLLGGSGAEDLPPKSRSAISAALLATLKALKAQALHSSYSYVGVPLSSLKHAWEALAPSSHALPDSYSLHSTLFHLASKVIEKQPFQLGFDVECPLSLLHAMLRGQHRHSGLVGQVMAIMAQNNYYHMSQRHQLKFIDALACLEEPAAATALLEHYSSVPYSSGGAALWASATVGGEAISLSAPALELVARHLRGRLVPATSSSPSLGRRYRAADLVLALLCFSRHPNHHASAASLMLMRGGGKATKASMDPPRQAHLFGMARAAHDPLSRLLADIEVDVLSQVEDTAAESMAGTGVGRGRGGAKDPGLGLAESAQLLSCYGQVGRRHDRVLGLLNGHIGHLLRRERADSSFDSATAPYAQAQAQAQTQAQTQTHVTQQRARLLQSIIWANAKVSTPSSPPPYLGEAVSDLLQYLSPAPADADTTGSAGAGNGGSDVITTTSTAEAASGGLHNPLSGNKNKALARLNGTVSLLWSLSIMDRLDVATFRRLEPILLHFAEHRGGLPGRAVTALERVMLHLRLGAAAPAPAPASASPATRCDDGGDSSGEGEGEEEEEQEEAWSDADRRYLAQVRPWEREAEAQAKAGKSGGGGGGDHVPSSGMHLDVSRTLRGLGVRHRNEVRVRGGYTVDILIPSRAGAGAGSAEGEGEEEEGSVAVALEVDGPFHYDTYTNAPLGATAAKRRALALMGYTVLSLPYWEWGPSLSAGDKERKLRDLLKGIWRR